MTSVLRRSPPRTNYNCIFLDRRCVVKNTERCVHRKFSTISSESRRFLCASLALEKIIFEIHPRVLVMLREACYDTGSTFSLICFLRDGVT